MAVFVTARFGLLSRCLLAASVLCLLGAGSAGARVGVTSAADGDPLGKPPNETERVLRIGIDVQADEMVTTRDNDRAHLMFLDGTSLTVGPNAQVKIDKFVYDPTTKQGDLAINATQGVFRLVGGKISKSNAIVIATPSSTIGIRGGITIFEVQKDRTTSNFIFGNSMTVTGSGQTVTATRPGSQVIVNIGKPPPPPVLLPPGSLRAEMGQLETGKSRASGGSGNADQTAQTSGFSGSNTGGPPNGPGGNQNSNGGPPNTNNNLLTQAVSNSTESLQGNTEGSGGSGGSGPSGGNTQSRTTQTITGFTNGLIVAIHGERSITSEPQVLFGTPNVSISTNASTNQAQGSIVLREDDVGGRSWRHNDAVVTLQLGGGNGTSDFVSNTTYALTQSTNSDRSSTVQIGERTHTINSQNISLNLNSSGVPNSTTAPNSSVTSGIPGSCTCAFLTWGWWSADITSPHHDQTFQVVSAPYVVGTVTTSLQMPMTGSATYNGFMTGNVQNGGSMYSATGSYSSVWNYAYRAGTFTAAFDGANYAGGAVSTSGGVNFTGGFVSGGGRVGTLSGSFFGPGAANQAGSFSISGPQYLAAGIFAGSKTSH